MKQRTRVSVACLLACTVGLASAQTSNGTGGEIADIIVTASRTEQDLQTAPVGATIITRAQIQSAGVVDANEAIRKIGGVAARTDLYGGREYTLDLRGFGGDAAGSNTVILIDGIRISENEFASARLSAIDANLIERIELVRGSSSVIWGEGAIAGTINIITRQDAKLGVSGQVGMAFESFDGKEATANLRLGLENKKGVLDLNARSYASHGYRDNNQSNQDTASIGYALKEGDLNLRARLSHEVSGANYPGPLSLVAFQTNPQQSVGGRGYQSIRQTRFSTGADYNFGAWTALVDTGVKNRNTESNYVSYTATNSVQISPRMVYRGQVGAAVLMANVGMDMSVWQYANAAYPMLGSQNNRAWFVMTDWLFPSQTRVVTGYRLEKIAKSYQGVNQTPPAMSLNNLLHAGELSVNQTIQKGIDVYARLASSYRVANIDESSNTNPSIVLRPQTSKDRELGVKWKQGTSNAIVRYFSQHTTDEISGLTDSLGNFYNVNSDPTDRRGVEMQGVWQASSAVMLSGSMQRLRANFQSGVYAGNRIPLVSEKTAVIRASYKLDAKQSLDSALRYLGSAYVAGDVSNTAASRIPSSRLLDVTYRYKMSFDTVNAVEVSVGIANLTNVRTYSYSSPNLFSPYAKDGIYPDPGRTLRAALRYNF